MNFEQLQEIADNIKKNLAAKRREMYQYARSKGFSSYESQVLQDKDKETIDQLAAERDAKNAPQND